MDTNSGNNRAGRLGWFAFGLGLSAQIAQVLIFRELLAVLHASELVFGLILACGLGWTALGGVVGNWWPKAQGNEGQPAPILLPACACWGTVLCGQLLLIRWWAGADAPGAGQDLLHLLPRIAVLTAPAALLSGFQFVLGLRALPDSMFGRLYRAESIGAVVGGMLFTFLLIGRGGPLLWAPLSAAALAALGVWSAVTARRRSRIALACSAVLYVLLAALGSGLDASSMRILWKNRLPAFELEETAETPYGRLTLLRSGPQVSIFQDASLIASIEPGASVAETRARADLCACLHPNPQRALVIGGTLGGLPEELLRHGISRIEAVETDPGLIELANRHGLLPDEPGLEYVAADGRYFLKRSPPGTYDLLLVSPGLPESGTGNRFCTVEFFSEARRTLTADGVMILLLPAYGASSDYHGGALLRRTATVWNAMRAVFTDVRAAPVEGHLLAGSPSTNGITFLPETLGTRIDERKRAIPHIRVPGVDEEVPIPGQDYFDALFGGALAVQQSLDSGDRQEAVTRFESALAGTSVAANSDDHPIAVAESLATGQEMAHGGTSWSKIVKIAAPVTLVALLISTALTTLMGLIGRKTAAGYPLLVIAAATGLFGMSIEVLLLHSYQNVRGYVYSEVGGLIACFMAGLALGAHAGTRSMAWWGSAPRRLIGIVAGCLLAGVLLCLLLPLLIEHVGRLAESRSAAVGFWGLMLATGFLDGLTFPPLVTLLSSDGKHAGGAAYAADLLGAGTGAVLCGAIWLPAFGIWGASWGTAGILVLAGIGLWGHATR